MTGTQSRGSAMKPMIDEVLMKTHLANRASYNERIDMGRSRPSSEIVMRHEVDLTLE